MPLSRPSELGACQAELVPLSGRRFRVGAWYKAAREPGPSRMATPLRQFLGLGRTRNTVIYLTPEGERLIGNAGRWERWAGEEVGPPELADGTGRKEGPRA